MVYKISNYVTSLLCHSILIAKEHFCVRRVRKQRWDIVA